MSMSDSARFHLRLTGAVWLLALSAGAATRGPIVVGPDDDLQAAINGANAGDVIALAAGATYTGNFVLRAHGGSAVVTIRTQPTDQLPKPGQRVTPEDAPRLAKL